jgi:N12 class adenine-specific DNA methylase/predicted RNA methylase
MTEDRIYSVSIHARQAVRQLEGDTPPPAVVYHLKEGDSPPHLSVEQSLFAQIREAFPNLSGEEAETALLLLSARAETLDCPLAEYAARFHPHGLAERDESLSGAYKGYVQFLGSDAKALIKAGAGADFSTFVHESAHVFRRQMTGALLAKAEKVFNVAGGVWTREQEETFARGLEEFVRTRGERDNDKREVFRKGARFIDRVYHGLDRIIDITPEMEAVYEELFAKDPRRVEDGKRSAAGEDASGGLIGANNGGYHILFQSNIAQSMFDFGETGDPAAAAAAAPAVKTEPRTRREMMERLAENGAFSITEEKTSANGGSARTFFLRRNNDAKIPVSEFEAAYFKEARKSALRKGWKETAYADLAPFYERIKAGWKEAVTGAARGESRSLSESGTEEPAASETAKTPDGGDHQPPAGSFHFEPERTAGDPETFDYAACPANKVFLVSEKDILEKERPSYIPAFDPNYMRNVQYYPPFRKRADGNYELERIAARVNGAFTPAARFIVTPEIFAATVAYYVRRQRAENKRQAKESETDLAARYGKAPAVKPYRVSVLSKKSMIQDQYRKFRAEFGSKQAAWAAYQKQRDEIDQKLLDMESQSADLRSSYAKGAETSYGDGGVDNALMGQYGVLVKRQNGDAIRQSEIEEIKTALDGVSKVFGNLSAVNREYGLKISHAADKNMHARKASGLFHDRFHAIGVGFARAEEAPFILAHETAHFLDALAGKESGHFFASDKAGTPESEIAEKFRAAFLRAAFRKNEKLSDYWKRTCECFARAMEQYAAFKLSPEHYSRYCGMTGYCSDGAFKREIAPLAEKLIETRRELWRTDTPGVSNAPEQRTEIPEAPAVQAPPAQEAALADPKTDEPLRTGDILFLGLGKLFTVNAVNAERKEITAQSLENGRILTGTLDDMMDALGVFSEKVLHFSRPDEELRQLLLALHDENFYRHNNTPLKEALYGEHIHISLLRGAFRPPLFFISKQNKLIVTEQPLAPSFLDPYHGADMQRLMDAARNGVVFDGGDKTDFHRRFIERYFPELYAAVSASSPKPQPDAGQTAPASASPARFEVFAAAFVSAAQTDPAYADDPVQAARDLLKAAPREERRALLSALQERAGGAEPEALRAYLITLAAPPAPEPTPESAEDNNSPPSPAFRSYGAWTDAESRLSVSERERINHEAAAILEKDPAAITAADTETLRRYSGFGGTNTADERGVLYDYYTAPPIAAMIWRLTEKALTPVETAPDPLRVLEPSCGTGVFFETAPRGVSLTGVELDPRSATIAQILHSRAEIHAESFERFNLSDKRGGFDIVIGNAPFGERSSETAFMDMPEETSLDRYFVSRGIDNLKDGGVMALITAPGVLENKSGAKWREDIGKKAKFLGAVKLPDESFAHAHTRVEPDILLFRKYPEDIAQRLSAMDGETFRANPLYDASFVGGEYFKEHPLHIMGDVSAGTGNYGRDEVKGAVTPETIAALLENFAPADETLDPSQFAELRERFALDGMVKPPETLPLTEDESAKLSLKLLRDGQLKIPDDTSAVYILNSANRWEKLSDDKTLAAKLYGVLALSERVRAVRDSWREGLDGAAYQTQLKLKDDLEAFKEKHGAYPADDADIPKFLKKHPSVSGVYEALVSPQSEIVTGDNPYAQTTEAFDGHNPAISALWTLQTERLDGSEERIFRRFPEQADSLIAEMYRNPDIFLSPEGLWELREDFISGSAWEKIDALEDAVKSERDEAKKAKLEHGIASLMEAAGWIPIEEADFSPHSAWIPEEIVNEWAREEGGVYVLRENGARLARNDADKWGVVYNEGGGTKTYNQKTRKFESVKDGVWTELADPLVYYLNMQKQRSSNIDTETYNRERNDGFKNFIANNPALRDRLERIYNRVFNSEIAAPVKTYPVTLAGWNGDDRAQEDGGTGGKKLRPHQWQTIHHLYRQGRGISALGTGFGKTLSGIGLIALLRQEGKIHRAWLQVPNNKVKDWVNEIKDVMPDLKIAYIDAESPEYRSRAERYKQYQRIASQRADIVIMPESAAGEIQLNAENDSRVSENIARKYKSEKEKSSLRRQEQAKEKGLRKAMSGKVNKTVSFEDFACDAVFVDEAHRFKNLFTSSLSRETGMNDGRKSDKAMSLFKKTEYIREQSGGKNVFLFTATPLTNSPLEYFNMISLVAPEELEKFGIHTIDGFIRNFADIQYANTYDWKTGKLENKRTLAGFKNIQSLQNLFFKYTDYQNDPARVKIVKPIAENQPNIIPQDHEQSAALKAISAELEKYQRANAEERRDQFSGQNFLTYYSRMRTASLDLELYAPSAYKNWKNPKLETLAQNAFESYQDTKGGQVVFCDRVFDGGAVFNMHEKIREYLVKAGFKKNEIIVINGFTKNGGEKSESAVEKETEEAVSAFNEGAYKVIIGTTACIGEGLNLQANSAALHHFDIPYRPSDFVQRNGRIDRQGNKQERVALHTYMSAGTIDNYSVSLVQKKANWIDKLLKTKSNVFANPESDSFTDADEILLALTEEWGDKEQAAARRAELERRRTDGEAKAWDDKRRASLASLSLLRGTTVNYTGDKGAKSYQARIQKMARIEKLLANNPAFEDKSYKDIADTGEGFLYSKDMDMVFREGDMFMASGRQYTVTGFDYKKQTVIADPTQKQYRSYGGMTGEYEKQLNLSRLRYEYEFRHFPQPSPAERTVINALHSAEFYTQSEPLKAEYYALHLAAARRADLPVPVFGAGTSGVLEINSAKWGNDAAFNPFTEEGKRQIAAALENGADFITETAKEQRMEEVKTFFPAMYTAIQEKLLPPFENTPDNLRKNIAALEKQPVFAGRPVAAMYRLLDLAKTPDAKAALVSKLASYGCVDPKSTKETLNGWISAERRTAAEQPEQDAAAAPEPARPATGERRADSSHSR